MSAEAVAAVLAGHQMRATLSAACTCGHGDIGTLVETGVAMREHRAHLADALDGLLREARAGALWDAADDWPREVNAEVLRREAATFDLRVTPQPYTAADWLRDRAERETNHQGDDK